MRECNLVLFITSSRPDPYVNCLAFVLSSRRIEKITFVSISEPGLEHSSPFEIVATVRQLINSLAGGHYPKSEGKGESRVSDDVMASFVGLRDRLDAINVSVETVARADLDGYLSRAIGEGSIFDVTALRKDLLADVATLLISRGHAQASVFELKRRPTHDVNDLYFQIATHESSYENILESANISLALRRGRLRRANRRVYLISVPLVAALVVAVNIFFPESTGAMVANALAAGASVLSFIIGILVRNE